MAPSAQVLEPSPPKRLAAPLTDKWVHNGVLHRLTKILSTYGLTWFDVDKIEKEGVWENDINDAINKDIRKMLVTAAAKYDLDSLNPYTSEGKLKKPGFSLHQPLTLYLQTMGDLPRAALRARYFRLRYVLGRGNTTRGQCRLCQKGNENNAHLVECPHLPVKFITWREELYDAIASQVGHRRSNTRSSLDLLHRYLTNMQWPKAHKLLVKRVVAYHRSLINMYAQLAPPRWEDPNTRDITIRRVRTPRPPIRINRNPQ